ncbi:MAG TPA: hypothetical protein DDX39_02900 [Bacteroidales bacterium]|nr:MAG: hypothetical protein A2W98_02985 [Bacteroidetes bacterium GWF2_33_38]HBF87566.1 hypothetical protein [Bacteroidales bacterium]
MKIISSFAVLAFMIFASCNTNNNVKESYKLAEKLSYSISLEEQVNALPILSDFDSKSFTDNILSKIKENKIQAYKFSLNEKFPISFANIEEAFGAGKHKTFTIDSETGDSIEIIVEHEIRSEEIKDFIFIENWFLNEDNLQIIKNVTGIVTVRTVFEISDSTTEYKEYSPFMVYFNDTVSNKVNKNLICQRAEYTVKLNKCDTLYTDFAKFDSKKLIDLLIEKVLNEDIKVYDYFLPEKTKLSVEDIMKSFNAGEDTIEVQDLQTGKITQEKITTEIDKNEITELVFVEEWYYDEINFTFEKKIIAYGPVREYYRNADPENKVKTVPFLIYFD